MNSNRHRNALAALVAAFVFPAGYAVAQDNSTRVSWAPSYGGACEDCDLRGRNMSGWDISNALYPRANLSGGLLRATRAINADFTGAIAERTDFRQAVLDGSIFTDAALGKARFDAASLLNSNFSGAILTGAKLRDARLNGATARRTDLRSTVANGADFSGSDVSRAIFDNSTLTGAQFNNAVVLGTSFKGARMDNASFTNVRLLEVDMTGATGLGSVDFEGACAGPLTKLPAGIELSLCVPLEGAMIVDLQ